LSQRIGAFQRNEVSTTLRVDPRVVLASQMLQLSQAELEQAIETELNENPALERLQDDAEIISDEMILKTVAPQELRPSSEDFEFQRSLPNDDDGVDWVDLASSTPSLVDHLRAQLLPSLSAELRTLGEFMVECVNDKGYLSTDIEDIAISTQSTLEDVEEVLTALQACEPAGVGARSLQECLLLQLRGAEDFEEKLARQIVKHCMDEFVHRRTKTICRKFRVLPEVVEKAFAEILCLSPYPGEGFNPSRGHAGSVRSVGVSPDLTLHRTDAGWTIEVKGADPSSLAVSRSFRRRMKELENMRNAPKDERKHLSTHVQRAADFIKSIEQRRQTIRRIGEYLVTHQTGFVSTGEYQFLQPLTRSKMAKDLDIHESTVSRATMDKFVQIANGEVVPFEVFFKPALRIQKMIEEILQRENPNNPLSDEAIAQMLAKKGVFVARRTVNKYRDRTKLLSSRKRRSA
jgi:RNA polymerase sigma-54 factor